MEPLTVKNKAIQALNEYQSKIDKAILITAGTPAVANLRRIGDEIGELLREVEIGETLSDDDIIVAVNDLMDVGL